LKSKSNSIPHVLSDPQDIANVFKTYFAGIGPALTSSIPPAKFPFSHYVGNKNPKSVFITSVFAQEISDEIVKLDGKKSSVFL
jgi:hypothetical protein